MMTWFVVFN